MVKDQPKKPSCALPGDNETGTFEALSSEGGSPFNSDFTNIQPAVASTMVAADLSQGIFSDPPAVLANLGAFVVNISSQGMGICVYQLSSLGPWFTNVASENGVIAVSDVSWKSTTRMCSRSQAR